MSSIARNPEKPDEYYRGLNRKLLQAIPDSALRILDVGCSSGRLGAAMKELVPGRQVYGLEREAAEAAQASLVLDAVFNADITVDPIPVPPESLDCVTCGDVLEHLYDPLPVLKSLRKLLRPDGQILVSLPNAQHHSVVDMLLRGEFQYVDMGLMDWTHVRFYTYASFVKLMLDAGFMPRLIDVNVQPAPPQWHNSLQAWSRLSGIPMQRLTFQTDVVQYMFSGSLMLPLTAPAGVDLEAPITFVVCVNDDRVLQENLLASSCLRSGTRHQVLLQRGFASFGEALNAARPHCQNDWIVCVHQDVYLPEDWDRRFLAQVAIAQQQFGPLGVAGVYGCDLQEEKTMGQGHLVDRLKVLRPVGALPARVLSLDEVLLAFPRSLAVQGDPALGYHQYGADLCLQAKQLGLPSVGLEAPLFHNSQLAEVPQSFHESSHVLAMKWRNELPIPTSCGMIGPEQLNPHKVQQFRLKRWIKDAKHFTSQLFRFGRKRRARQESLWK